MVFVSPIRDFVFHKLGLTLCSIGKADIKLFSKILDETHQRYVKARENKAGQSFVSGCIVDCETARSNSCESLVKNGPLSLTCKKQVSFASDCTLMKTGSKLYDLTPWRNSKGSLPNLSSSKLNVKFSSSNGALNDDTYVKRICCYFRKVNHTSRIIGKK